MKMNYASYIEEKQEEIFAKQRPDSKGRKNFHAASRAAAKMVFLEYMRERRYALAEKVILYAINDVKLWRLLASVYEKQGKSGKLKRFWRSLVAQGKSAFWMDVAQLEAYKKGGAGRKAMELCRNEMLWSRRCLLAATSEYMRFLGRHGSQREITSLKEEIQSIKNGKPTERPIAPDKRKVNEKVFWDIISESWQGATIIDEFVEHLEAKLRALKPGQIVAFRRMFDQKFDESYRQDLWAVGQIMSGGGCTDDGFEDFRGWLIAKGRDHYEAALRDPPLAAKGVRPGDEVQCEAILHVAGFAYKMRTGDEICEKLRRKFPKLKGKHWEEEYLPRMYPELCKRFG